MSVVDFLIIFGPVIFVVIFGAGYLIGLYYGAISVVSEDRR